MITLLVTDGLPSTCGPTAIADVSAIASNALAAEPSIKTFVVGVLGQDDVTAGAGMNLNQIAQAGGTGSASDDVSKQFISALKTWERLAAVAKANKTTINALIAKRIG